MNCPKCNYEGPSTDKFCAKCGHEYDVEHPSFTIIKSFKGIFSFLKGNITNAYIASLCCVVLAAVLIFNTYDIREELVISMGVYVLIFVNVIPFLAVNYAPEHRNRYLMAFITTVVLLVSMHSIGAGVRVFFPSLGGGSVDNIIMLKLPLLFISIPLLTFSIFYRTQNDINFLQSLSAALGLIGRNLISVIIMTMILSLLTIVSFVLYLLPALILLPLFSYSWAFFHRDTPMIKIDVGSKFQGSDDSND